MPDRKIVKTSETSYECKSIIIATGATKRPLGLEMEKELTGLGVSYCAICDGTIAGLAACEYIDNLTR